MPKTTFRFASSSSADWFPERRACCLFKFVRQEYGGFGPWARYMRHRSKLVSMLQQLIAERRSASPSREDILTQMLRVRYEDGTSLSNEDTLAQMQILMLITTGYETTAASGRASCLR